MAELARHVLLLGSNINKEQHLPLARNEIESRFGIELESRVYGSRAVGAPGTANFHNQAMMISTPLTRDELRTELKKIERKLGRVRDKNPNAPRTIDIDVVYEVDSTTQRALDPDPELSQHHHVALPVAEIDPNRKLDSGHTVQEVAESLGTVPPGFTVL